jgi:exopolysaccharide biosynthesis polyprenyl glycosylphosphotransferase
MLDSPPHPSAPSSLTTRTRQDAERPERALTPAYAHRAIDLVALRLVPAAMGGALAYGEVGEPRSGALVFAALLLGIYLTTRRRYPLHLMRAARVAVGLAGPVLGALIVLAVRNLDTSGLTPDALVAPVIGAWLMMAIGAGVSERLKADRPVRVAVVGTADIARSLAAELALARVRRFEAVGWVGPPAIDVSRIGTLEWLGALGELRAAVLGHQIDLLVYSPTTLPHEGEELTERALLDRIAQACLDLPVRMLDANQLYEELLGHVPIGTIDAAWFRYIMHPRYRPGSPLSKRVGDLVLGTAAALLAVPVVAIAAAAIRLEGRGPVLYRQRRVGEHGREFEMLKLRTMRLDSEPDGFPRWSSADDERVTRVGRVLRRFHIDELPQLWNVLRGEMTLVGPRPERPELVPQLERQFPHYERRHLVKPGITGWAQIRCGYAGSEMGSAWKLSHDLYYLKHRSLLADLLLIVETVPVALRYAEPAIRTPDERFILGSVEAEERAGLTG